MNEKNLRIYKSFYEAVREAEYNYDQRNISIYEFYTAIESATSIVFHNIDNKEIDRMIKEND